MAKMALSRQTVDDDPLADAFSASATSTSFGADVPCSRSSIENTSTRETKVVAEVARNTTVSWRDLIRQLREDESSLLRGERRTLTMPNIFMDHPSFPSNALEGAAFVNYKIRPKNDDFEQKN